VAGERAVDESTLETVLSNLLAEYPDAPIAAIGHDGLFVDVPPSLPVGAHPVLEGRSALDLVVPADRVVVITAWGETHATGIARAVVRLAADSGTGAFYFVDARHLYGVYVGVLLADGGGEAIGEQLKSAPKMPPRVCRVHKDGLAVISAIDDATTRVLGWEPDEIVGRRSLELIHPDDHDRAIENWIEMLGAPGGDHRWRGRHQRRDGSWVWMEITNRNRLDDPEHGDVVAEMVDISDEMAAQEALRAREQLLHRLAEALPLGVFQVDSDRSIVYANERLAEITCTGPATTVDAQLCTVVAEDRAVLQHALDDVLVDGRDADLEVRIDVPGAPAGRLCRITMRALTGDDDVVTGAIVCVADVTESARLRIELEHRATYDALTGCHNRASIIAALETTLASDNARVGTALVFVDLDGFKAVNDELGHAAGDDLLRIVASRLRDTTRDTDLVGRLGGDEFLVVCPRVASLAEVTRLCDRVAEALSGTVDVAGHQQRLRASIGVTWSRAGVVCADAPRCAEAIVAEADTAMYASKREGAGRPVLYDACLRDADIPA